MAKTKKDKSVSKKQQIDVAMNLFLANNLTQLDIAEMVGVSENTIKAWKDKYNWEELRGATESSNGKIIANILRRLNTITSQEVFSSDDVIKLTKAIHVLSPTKMTVSGQIETMKAFATYLHQTEPSVAKLVADHLNQFVKNCVKNAISV